MVRLRLTRMGSINKPFYRVIAIDSRVRRDGKYIENLGYYDPKHAPAVINIDEEKALKWLKVGATPSETVRSLFSKVGIMKKWHEMKSGQPVADGRQQTADGTDAVGTPFMVSEPEPEPVETPLMASEPESEPLTPEPIMPESDTTETPEENTETTDPE